MKQLYIKQKVFSLSGQFTVKDEQENDAYYVEMSSVSAISCLVL